MSLPITVATFAFGNPDSLPENTESLRAILSGVPPDLPEPVNG